VQLVSQISKLCRADPPTSQTDRQTDRQTDHMQSQYRALDYSALRGKNSSNGVNKNTSIVAYHQCVIVCN